jgi:hypothetical protein
VTDYIKYYVTYVTDYTAKNAQPVTMLLKTGLNNILLPILFLVVNNIACSAAFNVQSCPSVALCECCVQVRPKATVESKV